MWIPSWLGRIYAKLHATFGNEPFTFEKAQRLFSIPENRLAVAFSKLHANRVLLIFETTRPRVYRLLDPENFILLASGILQGLDRIPQERYVRLICDAFREVSRRCSLTSFAVYGSVARGRARKESDVDILLISDDFEGSLGSRVQRLCQVERDLEELAWLRDHGIYTGLKFYPLRREEAERFPLILLDLTEDAIILYDKERFLERVLTELKSKLLKLGTRRVFLDEDRWYWDLKPDYRFGEIVEIV